MKNPALNCNIASLTLKSSLISIPLPPEAPSLPFYRRHVVTFAGIVGFLFS